VQRGHEALIYHRNFSGNKSRVSTTFENFVKLRRRALHNCALPASVYYHMQSDGQGAIAMTQQRLARIAGLFYALNFVLGILSLIWLKEGRAAASGQMMLAAAIEYAIVVILLGRLFEPAGRALSWGVAAIGLAGCALSGGSAIHAFETPVNALAVFGLYCMGLGILVIRSRLVPLAIGVLLALGGVGWLTYAFPELAMSVAPYNMAAGAIAELILTLWLIIFGVAAKSSRVPLP
jgi:Domain of unknown function (DUF4386)